MYSYEDYLVSFYKSLKDQGFTPQNTVANILLDRFSLSDLFLGVPQPLTREQFLERYVKATEPLARAGFKYLNRTRRGGLQSAQARWGDQVGQRSRIEQAAITLLKSHPRRGLAQRIKQRCGLSLTVQRINAILKSSGI